MCFSRIKNRIALLLCFFATNFLITPALASHVVLEENVLTHPDTIHVEDLREILDAEAAMEAILLDMLQKQGEELARKQAVVDAAEQSRKDSLLALRIATDVTTVVPFHIGYVDSIRIQENIARQQVHPLTIDLVFKPLELTFDWDLSPKFSTMYFGTAPNVLTPIATPEERLFAEDKDIRALRSDALRNITRTSAELYLTTFDKLPDLASYRVGYIATNDLPEINFGAKSLFDQEKARERNRARVQKIAVKKWTASSNAIVQITQNYISQNWYKGGNSNFAILGILAGSLNYDNKKNVTWENSGEWRAGFNSVSGDTIRKMSTNEDLFRLYSKFGLKAFNKFYYASTAELKTQVFNTYNGMNSTTLKTAFFSPVRFNLTVGLDYRPNSDLSFILSPFSYKYIYVNDTARIAPTMLGIDADKKSLSEIGSSMRVEYTWRPVEEISIVSKFYFYTNYEKIETELEVVCNFVVNRFLTTRISLHPRYDSTVIMSGAEKAKLQFKEMISFGFAHKF